MKITTISKYGTKSSETPDTFPSSEAVFEGEENSSTTILFNTRYYGYVLTIDFSKSF